MIKKYFKVYFGRENLDLRGIGCVCDANVHDVPQLVCKD
jgi:hypothetical protein